VDREATEYTTAGQAPAWHPAGRDPEDPAAPAGLHQRSVGQMLGTLLGTSTGIGTILGGIAYGMLWNAYNSFYRAMGLTPEDVGLSRERLIVPAVLLGATIAIAILLFAIPFLAGYRLVPVKHVVLLPAVVFLVVCYVAAVTGLALVISRHDEGDARYVVIVLFAFTSFAVGQTIGGAIRLQIEDSTDFRPWGWTAAVVLGVVGYMGYFALAGAVLDWLQGQGSSQFLQVAVVVAPLLPVFFYLFGSGWRWCAQEVLPADGTHPDASISRIATRERRAMVVASFLAVLGAVQVALAALEWSYGQFDLGKRTVELGYQPSGRVLETRVRPVLIRPLKGRSDPNNVCTRKPPYAASLIGQKEAGWWILLRTEQAGSGYEVRVVWLHRDNYAVDLAPMVFRQPANAAEVSRETTARNSPWRRPACNG
jgi:hypothetical protein